MVVSRRRETLVRIHRTVLFSLGLLLALGALSAQPCLAQQPLKIGVFDAERTSRETVEGQRLYAQLNEQGQAYEAELLTLQDRLTVLQEQYQATSLSLSEAKRAELERQIESKQIELQTKQQTFIQQRQRDVERAMAQWSELVRKEVEAIGREGGYDLLLPSEIVPYFSAAVDVTEALVDRLGRADAQVPAEGE